MDDMFGGGRHAAGPRPGADTKFGLSLTLDEVAAGVERDVTLRLLDPCDRCSGNGAEPGTKPQLCQTCGGNGEVRRSQRSFFGQFVTVAPCPTCKGEGRTVTSPCKKCRGEGRIRGEQNLKVRVPAGVATGQYMTLRGVGNAGTHGAPRGDVHVVFEVEDDPRFERDGEDLYTEVLVTFPQLVLGASITVPVVKGQATLDVPAGTHSGQLFHLRGRGLPRINSNSAGDLHVRVQVWTPDRLSDEERALVKRLSELQPVVPADSRGKGFWSKMKEALGA
jgi:molecular chaperone DnaJ